jgi:hypothetical protein
MTAYTLTNLKSCDISFITSIVRPFPKSGVLKQPQGKVFLLEKSGGYSDESTFVL